MSKIAISFSGLPRYVPDAIKSWQWLIDTYKCDVFMHLWHTDFESVETILKIFRPIKFAVEPLRNLDVSAYIDRLQGSNPYDVFSMWSSIGESIDLIATHSNTYDRIVRARLDVAFENFEFLDSHGVVIPGKPAEVFKWANQRYPGWHDMMAYGDLYHMQQYANTLHSISTVYAEGSPFFSEFFLSTHLHRNKIPVTHHAVYADIVR